MEIIDAIQYKDFTSARPKDLEEHLKYIQPNQPFVISFKVQHSPYSIRYPLIEIFTRRLKHVLENEHDITLNKEITRKLDEYDKEVFYEREQRFCNPLNQLYMEVTENKFEITTGKNFNNRFDVKWDEDKMNIVWNQLQSLSETKAFHGQRTFYIRKKSQEELEQEAINYFNERKSRLAELEAFYKSYDADESVSIRNWLLENNTEYRKQYHHINEKLESVNEKLASTNRIEYFKYYELIISNLEPLALSKFMNIHFPYSSIPSNDRIPFQGKQMFYYDEDNSIKNKVPVDYEKIKRKVIEHDETERAYGDYMNSRW